MHADFYTRESPSQKLGVKYLDDIQLTNSFPDWKALFARIEEQRKIALYASTHYKICDSGRFPQMYDNIYAILGGRGTGKSSVALTIRQKMITSDCTDILLPIITPEVISEQECSILGWVLSATETVLHQLENRMKQLHAFSQGKMHGSSFLDEFFQDCQFQRENPLWKKYRELFKKSVQTSGDLRTMEYSEEDATLFRMQRSKRQYQLIQDLNLFWQQLTDCWMRTNGEFASLSGLDISSVKYPLIILVFDDIDLVPERSMELLNITFQYFTNPNIVILITAAEKTLKEVIRLKMLDRMVSSEAKSLLIDVFPRIEVKQEFSYQSERFASIERMSDEFYNKVIPPSSRYYLNRYTSISEKLLYSYSSIEQSFIAPQGVLSTPLDQFLIGQVNRLLKAFDKGKAENRENFLVDRTQENKFRTCYLMLFGNKSRNIANGCLEILNAVNRLVALSNHTSKTGKWTHEDSLEIYQTLYHLTQALMLSNSALRKYVSRERELICLVGNGMRILIQYPFIWEEYQKERQEILDEFFDKENAHSNTLQIQRKFKEAQKRAASLLMLSFFVEGLLQTVQSPTIRLHGEQTLSKLVNADVIWEGNSPADQTLFPRYKNVQDFMDSFPHVLEHLDQYVGVDLYSFSFAEKYLEDLFLYRRETTHEAFLEILRKEIPYNQRWVASVFLEMSVRYSGFSLLKEDMFQLSDEMRRVFQLFSFTENIMEEKEREIEAFFSSSNLLQQSTKLLDYFEKQLLAHSQESSSLPHILFSEKSNVPQAGDPITIWNDYFSAIKKEEKNYFTWFLSLYLRSRWNDAQETYSGARDYFGDKILSLAYTLSGFIDSLLNSIFHSLKNKMLIVSTKSRLQELLQYVEQIDSTTEQIRILHGRFLIQLRRLLRAAKDKEVIQFPAALFLDYMFHLNVEIDKYQMGSFTDYAYLDMPDLSGYYKAVEYLVIAHMPESGQEKEVGKWLICPAAAFVLDINLLENLWPFYFAAQILLEAEEQGKNDLYRREKAENQQAPLRKLYDQLTSRLASIHINPDNCFTAALPREKPKKSLTGLERLMQITQQTMAEQFVEMVKEKQQNE